MFKADAEEHNVEKALENETEYFAHSLFGAHLGCSTFWCAQLGCSDGAPKQTSNTCQNKWFGDFRGNPFLGTNLDHADQKRVPMQRGAHFAFLGSVPMQRGALFLIFDIPLDGSTWPQ